MKINVMRKKPAKTLPQQPKLVPLDSDRSLVDWVESQEKRIVGRKR
mgnify:CR=1 FL=1